jgi:hypothetical protein
MTEQELKLIECYNCNGTDLEEREVNNTMTYYRGRKGKLIECSMPKTFVYYCKRCGILMEN